GTIGDFGCLSFSSTKILAAPGNGGALVVKNPAVAEDARMLRFYGTRRPYYDYPLLGGNMILHEVQAAALLAKLDFFDHWLSHRKENAALYTSELSGVTGIVLPHDYPESKRVWYRYVIRLEHRDLLFERLSRYARSRSRLMPSINYPVPLPYFSVFQHLGYRKGDFPVAEKLSSEAFSLPITNDVSQNDVIEIAREIEEFFN
ncbi:MAG: DegT/DnrJ/EryC1/StrS family aminotransferase, partial [Patescibacteria group bacterium]